MTSASGERRPVRRGGRSTPNAEQAQLDKRVLRLALTWLAAAAAAVALAYLQARNIRAGWSACFAHPPDLDAGGNYAASAEGLMRLIGYPLY